MPIEMRQADGVSVVVINRPKWNLLDMEMIEQLSAAFERHDPEQPVVLAGEGEAFSAGVDTKAFAQYDAGSRIASIDVNPFLINSKVGVAVDGLIVLNNAAANKAAKH